MIKKIINQDYVDQVQNIFQEKKRFAIVAHVSPDGDALGSSLALANFLRAYGKEASVVLHDAVASNLTWVPNIEQVLFLDQKKEKSLNVLSLADVIVCVDFNAASRMGSLEPIIRSSDAVKIMVDHHLYPEDFCDVTISHPEISSTCELMYRLLSHAGYQKYFTKEFAELIYTGMMTDTGAFTYNSNAAETYYVVADLIRLGIDKDAIYDKVFNTCSENRERLKGYVLSQKMKLYKDFGASLFTLEQQELQAHDYRKGDSEGFVNMPLAIKGVYFSVFLREDKEYIKVSLRSKGDFPCNLFAEKYFNGGGHKNASGGEFWGTMQEAVSVFENALPEFYKELENKNK